MKIKYLILITCSTIISSCNNGEMERKIQSLTSEVTQLRDSLNKVMPELEGYRNSPEKLCSNIDELYKAGDIYELKSIKDKLEKYHPESKEYTMVKDLVSKYEKEQQEKADAVKKERLQAVNKLRKKYDDINHITWYENPYFRHYTNTNYTSIYIGQDESSIWLRLMMSYEGEDWIFFESAYLSYDGNTFNIPFDKYRDKKTENDTRVWEWIDVRVNDDLLAFLRKMVNGKSVKMRLSGKYTNTRKLTNTEIKAIKDVLLAYDVLEAEMRKEAKDELVKSLKGE
ncbi:MAG: hypothetical protein KHX52_06055 [Phocaeicola plebeius]|uniref:hypothetical protein n=1 Tax=Phocaeicola plebeius TaxID=310297 RepID=UPI00241FF324|nr:hypothetical protein [Phocaeicola plebeius]MBS5539914.1 hypothetical protein [Phocaeicola plebeius]